jgi:hypothetical protein
MWLGKKNNNPRTALNHREGVCVAMIAKKNYNNLEKKKTHTHAHLPHFYTFEIQNRNLRNIKENSGKSNKKYTTTTYLII